MAAKSPLLTGDKRPKILYGCILRPPKVMLAEHSEVDGNIQEVLTNVLGKLTLSDEWKSYAYGEHAFHYITDKDEGLCFLCMAEKDMGRRIPFAFLSKMQETFKESFKEFPPGHAKSASPQSLKSDYQTFKTNIGHLVAKYNSPDADRVANLMDKVQHVNDSLMESIDKLLDRQEKIDVLVQRSEDLATSSSSFHRDSQTLARTIWWRNTKMMIFLSVGAVVVIGLIIWYLIAS